MGFWCSRASDTIVVWYDDLGRLPGLGLTRPALARYRLTVAGATLTW